MNNIFKYEDPTSDDIYLIEVIGNEFSFFSISNNSSYGDKFEFSDKEDLINKIKENFNEQTIGKNPMYEKNSAFEKDTTKGSDIVTYNNITTEKIYLKDNIRILELNYSPSVRKIILDHLPNQLIEFTFNPMLANYKIDYSSSNNKNIKLLIFKNREAPQMYNGKSILSDSSNELILPKSIERLKIIGAISNFGTKYLKEVGKNFLTNFGERPYPNLKDIRFTYKDNPEERVLFSNGRLILPKEFNRSLYKLRDDVKSIEFESDSRYEEDIRKSIPNKLEYLRLPYGYKFYDELKNKYKGMKIEINNE